MSRPELPDDLARAADGVAPIPRDPEGAPVFREPWEAQAFAMTLALHERGLFTWGEWARALGAEIARAGGEEGASRDGSDFYRHWLATAERLVAEKGVASPDALRARRDAWARAARATPHGAPIRLDNDPEAGTR